MKVQPRMTIDNGAFEKTSEAALYEVGTKVDVVTEYGIATYQYVKAHADLTANQPYAITKTATGVETKAPATSSVPQLIGIPQVAVKSGEYAFVCIDGFCKAKVGTVTKDYALELLNGGTYLVNDGNAISVNSRAFATATTSAAGIEAVNLIGLPAQIAAS